MLRILQQFILTTFFAVFASQASAMFIQADWFDPTQPGVGTNRYVYSFNDPINRIDPNGNPSYNVEDEKYTVDDGDNWDSISDLTGVGVDELKELNENGLEVGGNFSLPRTKISVPLNGQPAKLDRNNTDTVCQLVHFQRAHGSAMPFAVMHIQQGPGLRIRRGNALGIRRSSKAGMQEHL